MACACLEAGQILGASSDMRSFCALRRRFSVPASKSKDGAFEPRGGIKRLLSLRREELCETLTGFEEEVGRCLLEENARTKRLEQAQRQMMSSSSKFEAVITAKFGDLINFKGGLDAHIGLPHPKVYEAITQDHEQSADSDDEFVSGNHGLRTTPRDELEFVVRPRADKEYAGLHRTAHGGPGRMPIELEVLLLAAGSTEHSCGQPSPKPDSRGQVSQILEGPHGAQVALVALTAAGMGEVASNLWAVLGVDWRSQSKGHAGMEPRATLQHVIEAVVRERQGWDHSKVRQLVADTLPRLTFLCLTTT